MCTVTLCRLYSISPPAVRWHCLIVTSDAQALHGDGQMTSQSTGRPSSWLGSKRVGVTSTDNYFFNSAASLKQSYHKKSIYASNLGSPVIFRDGRLCFHLFKSPKFLRALDVGLGLVEGMKCEWQCMVHCFDLFIWLIYLIGVLRHTHEYFKYGWPRYYGQRKHEETWGNSRPSAGWRKTFPRISPERKPAWDGLEAMLCDHSVGYNA